MSARREKASCHVCERVVGLNADGCFRAHIRYTAGSWHSVACPGAGTSQQDPWVIERGPLALASLKAAERYANALGELMDARRKIENLEPTMHGLKQAVGAAEEALAAWDDEHPKDAG